MGTPARVVDGRNREYEPPGESQLLEDLSGLVSPPKVCVKLYELVQSARASADDIAGVVSLDPNLTGRLLRIVNSPFYGFPAQIETVTRAVTILGVRELYNLVLAISAVRSFAKVGDGLVRMETFWAHSVFGALLARQLAKHFRVSDPDRLFVAGLLHDIGTCVIYSQIPYLAEQMRNALQVGEAALFDAESEYLGYTHASVGARILEEWQLPAALRDAVLNHHQPEVAQEGRTEAALVHIADTIAASCESGALSGQPRDTLSVNPAVWDSLGDSLDQDQVAQLVGEVNSQFAGTIKNLIPRGRHS